VHIAVVSSTMVPVTLVRNEGKNKHIDQYITDAKLRYRTIPFEKKGVVKHLAKALKEGGVIALMIDQNLTTRDGIVIDFFGKTALQTPAPAFLARKYNAVIIPSMIHPKKDGRQVIEFYEPMEVEKTDDAEADVLKSTQAQAAWLEEEIRKEPDHWFWCHRRWQRLHPEIYKVPK
jgi:KDO2-lipid IV(A) lauroyltransferase